MGEKLSVLGNWLIDYIREIIYLFFSLQNEDIARENITETLGTMAKVCLRMLENP